MNAEQYLVLFILVIFFILSGPLLDRRRVRERGLQPGGGHRLPRLTAPGAGRFGAIIGRIVSDAATGTGGRIRIFSGIQPTGSKHLGNLIGGVRQYVEGQERGQHLLPGRSARDHGEHDPAAFVGRSTTPCRS